MTTFLYILSVTLAVALIILLYGYAKIKDQLVERESLTDEAIALNEEAISTNEELVDRLVSATSHLFEIESFAINGRFVNIEERENCFVVQREGNFKTPIQYYFFDNRDSQSRWHAKDNALRLVSILNKITI